MSYPETDRCKFIIINAFGTLSSEDKIKKKIANEMFKENGGCYLCDDYHFKGAKKKHKNKN